MPHLDAASSHTDKITRKIHFPGPRITCGVTRNVHSSQQREERTKKRRRCYRAEAVAGCAIVGGCGTRYAQTVLALVPPPACPLPAR